MARRKLPATPASGNSFTQFSLTNGTTTTSNPLNLLMDANYDATSQFSSTPTPTPTSTPT